MTAKTPGQVPTWPHPDRMAWRIKTVDMGAKIAVLGYYWKTIESTLRFHALMLTVLSLMLLLTATFGVWILIGRILSPIYGLSVQADTASTDNLHIHLSAPSQDTEIVHLVGTLNALLGRLSGAISARDRFYAAASHELRTPLQTLKGYLELALMRERGAEEYRVALMEAYVQSDRLTSLVQALLLLNQLETAPVRQKQAANLADVCDRSVEELGPLSTPRRLRCTVSSSDPAWVEAGSSHLDILVRNLLENAIKYATADSEVQVNIRVRAPETRLTIYNECLPLVDFNEEKLFEPFYRPDASRSSDTGGNGLGLAICKSIAVANGWSLSVKRVAHGVRATVVFSQ